MDRLVHYVRVRRWGIRWTRTRLGKLVRCRPLEGRIDSPMPVSNFVELYSTPQVISVGCSPEEVVHLADERLDLLARQLTEVADRVPLDDQRLVRLKSHTQATLRAEPVRRDTILVNLARILSELDQEVSRLRESGDLL